MVRPGGRTYLVRKVDQLEKLAKEEHVRVIGDLSQEEMKSSASRWSAKHLLAYRLVIEQPKGPWLKALEDDHAKHCPQCNKNDKQTLDHDIANKITNDGPKNFLELTKSELLKRPDGPFWVALARAVRDEEVADTAAKLHEEQAAGIMANVHEEQANGTEDTVRKRSPRDKQPVNHGPYVNSTVEISSASSAASSERCPSSPMDMSSPPHPSNSEHENASQHSDQQREHSTQPFGPETQTSTQLSGSIYEENAEHINEDDYQTRLIKPEEVTVHLALSFLQLVLNRCLVQKPPDKTGGFEIRARVERQKAYMKVLNSNVTAEDDGGICRMRLWPHQGWIPNHPYIALLEAKRGFKRVDFTKSSPEPILSDDTLAQYLGEAVVTWRHLPDSINMGRNMFIIATTSTFLRAMHFSFGQSYREYLDAPDKADQLRIVDEHNADTCVHMSATDWFNLQDKTGRASALCHILALLRWHDMQAAEIAPAPEVIPAVEVIPAAVVTESQSQIELKESFEDEGLTDEEYSSGTSDEEMSSD
ncbi:hypothetical protein G7046_g8032 [Stylonectria norvegica]|nr:hypothetical protein G7046_g8032 [Stylonectria norvegica]